MSRRRMVYGCHPDLLEEDDFYEPEVEVEPDDDYEPPVDFDDTPNYYDGT